MNKILFASMIAGTALLTACAAPRQENDTSVERAGMHRMPDGSMMMDGGMHRMPNGDMMMNGNMMDDDAPGTKKGDAMDMDDMSCCKNCMGGMGCGMMANGGSMDHDDMTMGDMVDMLDGKTGDELDAAFLEGMIPHHQGAIDMAELLLENAKHDELKQMARDIIEAQQREIDMMKRWQKDWGYTR